MHYPHFQCARKGWGWLWCNTVSWPNLQTRGGCSGCKAKRGARAGSLLFWWAYLSPSVSKVKKEINSCVQGLNPSLDKTGRGAGPLDVPSLHLWAHTWVLPMVVGDLCCSAVLATTPDIMAREQGVGTRYPQNTTACCRSAPSFLLCAALVTNVGVIFCAYTNPGAMPRELIHATPLCDANFYLCVVFWCYLITIKQLPYSIQNISICLNFAVW